MNKVKSILALMLMGGLLVVGCKDKNSITNGDDSQQSGDQGGSSSGGNQSGDQGGSSSGGNQSGDEGGQQGGEGGGQQGGGDVQVDHFGNKKLTIESITANPADHLAEIQAMYANAYLSLFSEGSTVEMILPMGGGEFQALLGTYAVSQDGLTATITATDSYISTLHMHFALDENDVAPFALTFDAATSKYSMTMPVAEPAEPPTWQANATFVCVAAQEAPTHANMPEAAPAEWPGTQIQAKLTEWGVQHDTVPSLDVSSASSVMFTPSGTSISIMVLGGGSLETTYKEALVTAGYELQSMYYKTANEELQFMVVGMGENLMISITCLIPQIVAYTFEITLDNQWILNDSAKIYIWAWSIYPEIPGHWYLGNKVENTITFEIPSNLGYGIMVRSPGMSDLDAWIESEVWNESDQFALSGTSGAITPAPVIAA